MKRVVLPESVWDRIKRAVQWVEAQTDRSDQPPPSVGRQVPFQFRRFRLKYALTAGSSTTATRIEYDPVTGGWTDREEFLVYDLVGNYSGIGDYAADGYTYNGKVGHVGVCYHPHDVDKWYICELRQAGGSETITVTLAENMGATTSQQASATVDADPGTAYVGTGLAESDPVTVHDPQNLYRLSLSGAKGKATLAVNADTAVSEWVLVDCEKKAKRIRYSLTQDMQSGSPKYATAHVDQHYDGQHPDPGDADITVYDDAGLYGDAKDTASGFAFLDEIVGSDHYGEYIMDTCNQLAFIGRALVNDATKIAWNESPITVDGIDVAGPGNHSQVPSGVTSMTNLFGWPANDDADVFWFRDGSTYYAIPEPPLEQIDVVGEVDYDTGTHSFTAKEFKNTLVWQADDLDASGTAWHGPLTTDKFVIDSQITAGNSYEHKETTVYCIEAPVDDGTFDNSWATGSEC